MIFYFFENMRNCSTKKIGYSSKNAAISALIELHKKSSFSHGQGPQNVYRCEICDQYHLTSRGPAVAELQQRKSTWNDTTQNEILRWEKKFKKF